MINATAQEIDRQLAQEALAFNSKLYDGRPLPEDIIQKVRQGIMVLGCKGAGEQASAMKALIAKNVTDLSWMEVGWVVNFVQNIPYERVFDTVEEALDYHINLGQIQKEYNEVTMQLEKELNQKRQMKYKLAGLKLSVNFERN